MKDLLLQLLVRLEAVGERDESLFDTVVREKMGEPIFDGFLKPRPGFGLPDDYGMPDDENRRIKDALRAYIQEAKILAKTLGIESFHDRLAAFQNAAVSTERNNYYDDFFGWINPSLFDEAGNIDPQP